MPSMWWMQTTSWAMVIVICLQFVGCTTTKLVDSAQEPPELEEDQAAIQFTEFSLGPGDELEVEVYRYDELKRAITVPGSGIIFYPLVGEIDVKSMGVTELRRTIQERLKERIIDPQVSVSIKKVKSQKVYVLGEVLAPSVFTLDSPMRAAEIISKAGGFTSGADRSSVVLVRNNNGKPDLQRLNIDEFFEGAKWKLNAALQPGDVIYVPRSFVADLDKFFDHVLRGVFAAVLIEQGFFLAPKVFETVTGKAFRSTNSSVQPSSPTIIINH